MTSWFVSRPLGSEVEVPENMKKERSNWIMQIARIPYSTRVSNQSTRGVGPLKAATIESLVQWQWGGEGRERERERERERRAERDANTDSANFMVMFPPHRETSDEGGSETAKAFFSTFTPDEDIVVLPSVKT